MGKIDVNSILSKAAQKTDAKPSKSKTPVVELPNHKAAIDAWLKAHADEKDAKARMATAEQDFLGDAEDARVGECRRDGKFHTSVKLNGQVTVSVQNRYSPIDPKEYGELEKAFGNKAEDFFKSKTEISLTDAALNDETLLQKLIAAVGEDKVATYFNVKQFVQPTELFHETRALNAEVGEKAKKLIDEGIIRPFKASVKVGG